MQTEANHGGSHYPEYVKEGRKNKKRKTEDQSLNFKTLLGIARNKVSLKVEETDAQQTFADWIKKWPLLYIVIEVKKQKWV